MLVIAPKGWRQASSPVTKLNQKKNVFSLRLSDMNRLAKLQLIGPMVLFAGLLAAQAASHALVQVPSSPMLWYARQELFGLFRANNHFLYADFYIAH